MKPGWGLTLAIVGVGALTALIVFLAQGIPSPQDGYQPNTASGRVVYLEACAKCHGAKGEGTALAPSLKAKRIPSPWVQARVETGTGRMPRFPNIKGEALKNLSRFVNKM